MHLGLLFSFFKKKHVSSSMNQKRKVLGLSLVIQPSKKRKNAPPTLPVVKIEMKPWICLHNNGC